MPDTYSENVERSLKALSSMPIESYEAGWTRGEKTYPSFKEYLWTARPREHYDVFLDVNIKGNRRTYWIYYGTLGDFARRKEQITEDAKATIIEALEQSDPALVAVMELDYYWRSSKSEEEVAGGDQPEAPELPVRPELSEEESDE